MGRQSQERNSSSDQGQRCQSEGGSESDLLLQLAGNRGSRSTYQASGEIKHSVSRGAQSDAYFTDFAELERRLQKLGEAVEPNSYYEAAQADLDFIAVVAEHSPLIAALSSKDPQQMRAAFGKNVTSSYEAFLGNGDERSAAEVFGLPARDAAK